MNTNEQPADEAVRLLDESQLLIPFSRERSFEETKNQARILIQKCIELVTGRLQHSLDFYKRRCDALQKIQSNMRDPERKMVCDILANGSTSAQPQPSQGSPQRKEI